MALRHLDLREGDPPYVRDDLSDDEARALSEAELVIVSRAPGARGWTLAAGRKVGVVRIGDDLQVSVRPKVEIARLLFMMGYAREPSFWRDGPVLLERDVDFASMLGEAFRRFAGRATERGLLQGYRTVEEAMPVMRGRLRANDQIGRWMGILLPLEVTYDDFTVDIPENRLLLAATIRLLQLPGVAPFVRQSLRRLRLALADVTLVDEPIRWTATRLNRHYEPALRLADLILDGDSIEQVRVVGAVSVTGFVLDMWKVYEDFVCTALKQEFERHGGRATLQRRTHLDERNRIPMEPDLLWENSLGPQVIVDAKYKEEKSAKFPNADLYQMLAYCTVLGRRHGHLVYAKGEAEERTFKVTGADVTMHCHTLDLSLPPADLLTQVGELAARVLRPWRGQ